MGKDIEAKITEYLKQNTVGVPALQIAKDIGHNRITVGKYLDMLKAQGLVECRSVGQANLWSLPEAKKKSKILVVDDEEPVLQLLTLTLESPDVDIVCAHDGDEALEIVAEQMPDLIVLDIMMPKKDGIEVCTLLKNNTLTKNICVILLSAKSQVEDKVKGLAAGADYYMTKPFDPQELTAVVTSKLKQRNAETIKDPITQLEIATLHSAELQQAKANKLNFARLDIEGFEKFVECSGFKQGAYVLQTFTKLLFAQMEKKKPLNSYVGMVGDNSFLIACDCTMDSVFESLQKDFSGALPFLRSMGPNTMCPESLSLTIKSAPVEELLGVE